MFLAHAGHQHLEETSSSISQPTIIAGVVLLVTIAIVAFLVFDVRRKRAAETISKK